MTNEGVEILLALYRHRHLEGAKEMSEEEIDKLLRFWERKKEEEDAEDNSHQG